MDRFAAILLSPSFWLGLALIALAIVADAYDAWRSDVPWFGYDLRMRRWRK